MSVALPWTVNPFAEVLVTKLASDGLGRTNVEATYAGRPFMPFSLDRDVAVVGADALRNEIEFVLSEQIKAALDLAR